MTTRSRNFTRTPRRRKLFIGYNHSFVLGVGTASPKVEDMLDTGFTELGMSNMGGLTFMKLTGKMALEQHTASPATSSQAETIRIGFNWLDPNIVSAGDGDSQIPEAMRLGLRETKWIQQWQLSAVEPPVAAPVINGALLEPVETSLVLDLNVRNMRKQPSANSKLAMVVSGGSSYETNVVRLEVAVSIMLALP